MKKTNFDSIKKQPAKRKAKKVVAFEYTTEAKIRDTFVFALIIAVLVTVVVLIKLS